MTSATAKQPPRIGSTRWQASRLAIALLLLVLAWALPAQAQIPGRPNPPRLVNDFAAALAQDDVQALEAKLRAYDDSTSTQIAIVSVKTLDGYDVGQFAVELAEKWGIGQKKTDNGILILFCPEERKITIQTGYGTEARLTDGESSQIIKDAIKPNFRSGDYYQGLDQATDRIIAELSGEYQNTQSTTQSTRTTVGKSSGGKGFIIVIIIFVLMYFMFRKGGGGGTTLGGRRNRNNDGGLGSLLPWILLGQMGSGGGRSSGWGGSGDSGGGSSWGGFGGGSFGGGGASGDW